MYIIRRHVSMKNCFFNRHATVFRHNLICKYVYIYIYISHISWNIENCCTFLKWNVTTIRTLKIRGHSHIHYIYEYVKSRVCRMVLAVLTRVFFNSHWLLPVERQNQSIKPYMNYMHADRVSLVQYQRTYCNSR